MIKVLFVCLGNICRSPMAEFLFKDMIREKGMEQFVTIASAATSSEEVGNEVHPGTRKILMAHGIQTGTKRAVQIKASDYEAYDFIIGMEQRNVDNMLRVFGKDEKHKISKLLDFTSNPGNIADPWYTGDFEATYQDVQRGLEAFYEHLVKSGVLRK